MDEFLTELIQSDNLFNMTQNHIYFENWIKSGILYIKDVFDDHDDLYDTKHFIALY